MGDFFFCREEMKALSQRRHAPPPVTTPPKQDPAAAAEKERAAAEIVRLENLLEKECDEKRSLQNQVYRSPVHLERR